MFLAGTLFLLFQRHVIYNHALAAAAADNLSILPACGRAGARSSGRLSYLLVCAPESGFANQPVHEQDRLVLWDLPLCVADPINDRVLRRPVDQPLGALGGYFGARLGGGLGELGHSSRSRRLRWPIAGPRPATPIKRGSAAGGRNLTAAAISDRRLEYPPN